MVISHYKLSGIDKVTIEGRVWKGVRKSYHTYTRTRPCVPITTRLITVAVLNFLRPSPSTPPSSFSLPFSHLHLRYAESDLARPEVFLNRSRTKLKLRSKVSLSHSHIHQEGELFVQRKDNFVKTSPFFYKKKEAQKRLFFAKYPLKK